MNFLRLPALALVVTAVLGGGCAETQRARTVGESGFLQDYSRLQPGAKDEALLRYRNPAAAGRRYDKILIEPVRIFRPEGASEAELADLRKLAGNFNVYLARELATVFQIVQAPEPGALRVEAAITGAEKSGRAMDFITSVVPVGMVISQGRDFATGKPSGVGEISAEMRLSDAVTGEVLGEAVDRRVGGKNPSGIFDAWNDADKAMQYWARRLAYLLCVEHGSECAKP